MSNNDNSTENKMIKFQSFVLILILHWMLHSCDLFGEDDGPKPKSTEFVFRVDTLTNISFYTVNDLDVIDDTSFVITGFFVERNEDGSTKNVYNQIWWGKKMGYEFKAMPQLAADNSIITTSIISYFAGNANYHVYGGSSRYSIFENGVYEHQRLQDGDGFFEFDNIELIRPGEFYLYGRNGSLAYYKDGRFSKIAAPSNYEFILASAARDSLLLLAYELDESKNRIGNAVFSCTKNKVVKEHSWDFDISIYQPQFFLDLKANGTNWIYMAGWGGYGIYSNQTKFNQIQDDLARTASINEKDDIMSFGVGGYLLYFYRDKSFELLFVNPDGRFRLPDKMDYKNDLVILSANRIIYIGERKQ